MDKLLFLSKNSKLSATISLCLSGVLTGQRLGASCG